MDDQLKIFSVTWVTDTAGPSPDYNDRTEVFLFGCKKAIEGNPCKGCFNQDTWDASPCTRTHDPKEVAANINKHAPNKYVTIGGGEPTDQIDSLIELCKELKKYDFHIMVYTWRRLKENLNWQYGHWRFRSTSEMNKKIKQLLNYVDIIVDGEFIAEERMYQKDAEDGTYNSVGSGNQIVWDVRGYNRSVWPSSMDVQPHMQGYKLADIDQLALRPNNNELIYFLKDKNKEPEKVYL